MAKETREEMIARMHRMRDKRDENRKLREVLAQTSMPAEVAPEPLADPTQELSLNEHTWLGEPKKSLFIPSWYRPHTANFQVTQHGVPLGFKVGDVLKHRRWAIKGNGELLDQREFEPLHERYLSEIAPPGIDPKNQHIPRVERYVNAMPDPRGGPGYVAIGFDPTLPAPPDDGMRYDPATDAIFSIKEDLERSMRLERVEALTAMRVRKEISGETFEREMRKLSPTIELQPEPSTEATPVA